MKKVASKEDVVRTIFTAKGKWEIYVMKKGGRKQYANRLVSRNGLVICHNSGFNTVQNALKNIRAVQNTAK